MNMSIVRTDPVNAGGVGIGTCALCKLQRSCQAAGKDRFMP